MEIKNYDLSEKVPVYDVGYDSEDLQCYVDGYKRFCEDLLTYVHSLEARIAKLEHNL